MELQINIDIAVRAIELKSILYALIFDFLSRFLSTAGNCDWRFGYDVLNLGRFVRHFIKHVSTLIQENSYVAVNLDKSRDTEENLKLKLDRARVYYDR